MQDKIYHVLFICTGNSARSICAAGHKAMYHDAWGGLPSAEFLESVEPGLSRFRYDAKAVPSNKPAGRLCESVARQVGLSPRQFDRNFRVIIEDQFVELQQRMLRRNASSAEQRYAHFVEQHPELAARVPNVHIASYLGVTPEFLSRLRAKTSKGR